MNCIKIERVHRVGNKNQSTCRTMIAKFTSYKTEESILKEARNQKPQDIWIYEDFSKATVKIIVRKGTRTSIVYDKIYKQGLSLVYLIITKFHEYGYIKDGGFNK